MTWLKLDDEFPDHEKVVGLSDAAFRLHVRVLCWCAHRETDGMIAKNAAEAMARNKRCVTELVSARLWELKGTHYEVHDFLKYNPSHAQQEAARTANANRIRSYRNLHAHGHGNDPCNAVTGTVTDAITDPVTTPPVSPTPDPRSPIPDPIPSGKQQPKDLPESARGPNQQHRQDANLELIPCPTSLRITDAQRATLETALIPDWAIELLELRFVAKATADEDDRRTLKSWRKSQAASIAGNWNNPNTRPVKPGTPGRYDKPPGELEHEQAREVTPRERALIQRLAERGKAKIREASEAEASERAKVSA